MDISIGVLKTVRTVAELRSFTAAAAALGYTQSAVSRQVATAENEFGTTLFERGHNGVRLTRTGGAVLRHIVVVLDALEQARTDIVDPAPQVRRVRIGAFAAAGAALLPQALAVLRRAVPDLEPDTREGSSPSLVRSVRSGSLDFAVVTARPPYRSPDLETPSLVRHELFESGLVLAVPSTSRFAASDEVHVDAAAGAPWVASPSTSGELQLGVWPGLPGRPRVRHWARDWTTKLKLVANGSGVTTVPLELFPQLPEGVTLVRIAGVPPERRLVSLIYREDSPHTTVADVLDAMTAVAEGLVRERKRTFPSLA